MHDDAARLRMVTDMTQPQPSYPEPVAPPAPAYPAPAPVPVAPPVSFADPAMVTAPPLPPTPSPIAPSPYAVPEAPAAPVAPPLPTPDQVVAPAPYGEPSVAPPAGDYPGTMNFQAPVLDQETSNDAHLLKEPMPEVAGRPELERLLSGLVANGGSDLHLVHGQPPRFRQAGELLAVGGEQPVYSEDIERLMRGILSPTAWDEFVRNSDLDTSYAMDAAAGAAVTSRFRVNAMRSMGAAGIVIRVIPSKIVTAQQLGLKPQIINLAKLPRGLVLFCGPTGSGKALGLSTPIPTPTGVTTMGDLREGDWVLGRDGLPCRVTGLSSVNESPDLYRVSFSDGQTVIADYDHQWLVSTHHGRNVPRTKKRLNALDRSARAHMTADYLDEMSDTWTGDERANLADLHVLLGEKGLTTEYPSQVSVYNALRMTDCPSWYGTRKSNAGTESRNVGPWLYPVRRVLEDLANGPSSRAPIARDLLTNVTDLPEHASCVEIGRMLGGAPHSVARDVVRRLGLEGVPTRVDEKAHVAREMTVVVYPTAVALKSLAVRLRQRFANAPTAEADLSRMTTGEMLAVGLRLNTGHARFAAPVGSALALPEAALPVDPYVMGAWLGDGHSADGRFAQSDRETFYGSDRDFLAEQVAAAGYTVTYADGQKIGTEGLTAGLRASGVLGAKHIPGAYLRASTAQRTALLQGLMDTDGTIDENGSCELSLSDRRLAAGALDLIRSLGIKASVSWGQPAGYRGGDGCLVECKDRHRIHFTTDQQAFRLPRKAARLPEPGSLRETQRWLYITDIEPVLPGDADYGPARCITVDSADHTYLVGDGYAVTSNSTSMAALVNEMNETRPDRIITLEDPVEFVHTSKKCLVSHREIGEDTPSFEEGLRRVRRQDPDIILVGEMRDYETIAAAIEAADTGHLVLGTLHTNSAPETISRIINSFPAAQQAQIRTTLSSTLKAVICQSLVPSPKASRGRVLATEIMLVNGAISANIRDNDIKAIQGALVDRSIGNLSLDAHLVELFQAGLITKKEALKKASSERAFNQALGTNRENM